MRTSKFNLPLAMALAAALSASPALAQSKGHGNSGRDRDRVERRDRDDDHRDEPRFERRRSDDRASSSRSVPPGWCQGRGNPHNTAANCRYNSSRREWERYDSRDRRWETRSTYERGSNGQDGSGSSYETAHRNFHYTHDRQCRERAAQRPLDLRFQVQVRQECAAVHQEWHRRAGIAHR
jgi:hypothetical protein